MTAFDFIKEENRLLSPEISDRKYPTTDTKTPIPTMLKPMN